MIQTVVEEFTSTPEGMAAFQQERVILEVAMAIRRLLKECGMTKAELAVKLGKSPSYITQLLDGRTNMTLRTISDVFVALDRVIRISVGPLNSSVEKIKDIQTVEEWGNARLTSNRALSSLQSEAEPNSVAFAAPDLRMAG